MQRQTAWIEKPDKWHYLVTDDGEVIAAVSAYKFPFACFIGGAGAGEYATLEIAKEKLIEKCRLKKLL
jgi:hypothetical protein